VVDGTCLENKQAERLRRFEFFTLRQTKIEYAQCASSPIGLEAGDSKSLGGTHSACQFDPDLAH
jgi:hypothetical protein